MGIHADFSGSSDMRQCLGSFSPYASLSKGFGDKPIISAITFRKDVCGAWAKV